MAGWKGGDHPQPRGHAAARPRTRQHICTAAYQSIDLGWLPSTRAATRLSETAPNCSNYASHLLNAGCPDGLLAPSPITSSSASDKSPAQPGPARLSPAPRHALPGPALPWRTLGELHAAAQLLHGRACALPRLGGQIQLRAKLALLALQQAAAAQAALGGLPDSASKLRRAPTRAATGGELLSVLLRIRHSLPLAPQLAPPPASASSKLRHG